MHCIVCIMYIAGHIASHTVTKCHTGNQRQSKAIKGLKFEDCILTFKEPSSQISHSGDILGKHYFQEESCRRNDKQSTNIV